MPSIFRPLAGCLLASCLCVSQAYPQDAAVYASRLSPLPVDATLQPTTTGVGAVEARLDGRTLRVSGTFQGLQGPATEARIHVGPPGMRGPALLELSVTKAPAGTVEGLFTVTDAQLEHLRRNRLYVQIHSTAAPEGNLRGWLMPPKERR
ncbi:MAG: CHRD domain-containing protein [Acidobacteria bacterium]|nr:CHRD domain-containing protein [Acidobacteriota bacterium]